VAKDNQPFVPTPNFETPDSDLNAVEKIKLHSNGGFGNMYDDFRNLESDDVTEETMQLAKSHGVYLEWNRDESPKDKQWMYMIRVSIPGGGSFTADQWRVFDECATKYAVNPEGLPSLRVTTRQNIQYHWVKKADVPKLVSEIAQTGFFTLNGCGDNFRNTMGCPLSKFSNIFDANELAKELAAYFQLPAEPHIQVFGVDPTYIRKPGEQPPRYEYGPKLLNRKFKVGIAGVHQHADGSWHLDNCVELRTNEIGIAPIVENGKVDKFMTFIGGGQGENNNKPTSAMHGEPFGVFTRENLLAGLHAIVKTHEHFGDRQNRHWARMKYVVRVKGIEWFRDEAAKRGAIFDPPIDNFDTGPRCLHHGWHEQPSNGLLAFGAYLPNGRLMDGEDGRLKTMVREILAKYEGVELMTTPNQDILFTNIPVEAKATFEDDLRSYGWGTRHGRDYSTLRKCSGACVALPTCALAYTDSERLEPYLLDELEERGYGEIAESIGITGCERQCFRPATKTIGWVGQGPNLYAIRLGGSEDARYQGVPLSDGEQWYLRRVPRDKLADVCAALFDGWLENREDENESLGQYHRRIGGKQIVAYLKQHPNTAELMEKTYDLPYIPVQTV
jgi:sulfite reductase (NADPH) hemoprotein beta-component